MNYAIDQMMRAAEDADGTIDTLRDELAAAERERDAAVTAHAALACAFAAWLEMPVPARVETLPLLARMGDAA